MKPLHIIRWNLVGLLLVFAATAYDLRGAEYDHVACRSGCSKCDGGVSDDTLPGILNLNLGTQYFDIDNEALWGGSYSVDYATRIAGNLAFFGTAEANHIPGGTQILGGVGVFRAPFYDYCSWHDRVSFASTFHYFTDTRVTDLFLAHYRGQVGYLLTPDVEVGAIYTTPLGRDEDVPFVNPVALITGSLGNSETISAYATRSFDFGGIGLQVGYRENPNSLFLGLVSQVKLTDDVGMYANVNYEDRPTTSTWAATVGFTIELADLLHRGPKRQSCCATRCELASVSLPPPPTTKYETPTVVRGQDSISELIEGLTPSQQSRLLDNLGRLSSSQQRAYLLYQRRRLSLGFGITDPPSALQLPTSCCEASPDQRAFYERGGGMMLNAAGTGFIWQGVNGSHPATTILYNPPGTGLQVAPGKKRSS